MTVFLVGFFLLALGINLVLVGLVIRFAGWVVGRFPKRPQPTPQPIPSPELDVDLPALERGLVELERRAAKLQSGRHLMVVE